MEETQPPPPAPPAGALRPYTATAADRPAAELARQYAADGFLLLSGLLDDGVAAAAADLLTALPGMDGAPDSLRPPDQYVEARGLVEHYARRDPALLACFSDAFVGTVGTLTGKTGLHRPDGVQTQNLVRLPDPWRAPGPHIDGIPKENRHRSFPGPYEIAFIFFLSDVRPQGGGTVGWPGSHAKVHALAESDPKRYEYLFDLNRAVAGLDLGEPVELLPRRGDVLFFRHMWVHGAPFNTRPEPRLAIRPLCSCPSCNTRWYKRDGWSFWQP